MFDTGDEIAVSCNNSIGVMMQALSRGLVKIKNIGQFQRFLQNLFLGTE